MKRDLLRLITVLAVIAVCLPLFAWIQSMVGYETFAVGGLVIVTALAIVSVLITVITLRKEKNR